MRAVKPLQVSCGYLFYTYPFILFFCAIDRSRSPSPAAFTSSLNSSIDINVSEYISPPASYADLSSIPNSTTVTDDPRAALRIFGEHSSRGNSSNGSNNESNVSSLNNSQIEANLLINGEICGALTKLGSFRSNWKLRWYIYISIIRSNISTTTK